MKLILNALIAIAAASALRVPQSKSIKCVCNEEKFKSLITIAEMSHHIFNDFLESKHNVRFRPSRVRRHKHEVDMSQNVEIFNKKIHQKLSKILKDLSFVSLESATGDHLKRTLDYFIKVLNVGKSEIEFFQKSSKNENLLLERSKISFRHITEIFLSISFQC